MDHRIRLPPFLLVWIAANPQVNQEATVSDEPAERSDDSGPDGSADDVQARVEEAVAGLKKTNAELKQEKTALKQKLDELSASLDLLGGTDGLRQLASLRERLQTDDLGRLLADGQIDEWFDRRAQPLRDTHQQQINERDQAVQAANQRASAAETLLQQTLLKTAVSQAAARAGVEPTAMLDILLRAERSFTFDPEHGQLVERDAAGGVRFSPDGRSPRTIDEWLADQKETARHWWPPSRGGGAGGSGLPTREPDLSKMTFHEYKAFRDRQDSPHP